MPPLTEPPLTEPPLTEPPLTEPPSTEPPLPPTEPTPPLHALFDQRYSGDDALLRLARLRFEQSGLAAELDGADEEFLEHLLAFAPSGVRAPTTHLPRSLDLTRGSDVDRVVGFVERFGPRLSGFVVHDKPTFPQREVEVSAAAQRISRALRANGDARLFVEYAARLEIPVFARLADVLGASERVGVCLDVGHIAVAAARRAFALRHPDVPLTSLSATDPRLPALADDVQAATAAGLPAVLEAIEAVAAVGRPVHYHLHDGHPMGAGLRDHYTFQHRIPVPFLHDGRRSLAMLFGPLGLGEIVRTARRAHAGACSFTLEIHHLEQRVPLGDAEQLFTHWSDLTHAELMNGMLAARQASADLVRAMLRVWPETGSTGTLPAT